MFTPKASNIPICPIIKIVSKYEIIIESPPNLTVGFLCIFLGSGSSKILNLTPIFFENGKNNTVNKADKQIEKIIKKNIFSNKFKELFINEFILLTC